MSMEYTHTPLDETVEFVAGSYQIESEHKLLYEGREILYLMGSTSELCGCCGSCDSIRFITVPGFIMAWKSRSNDAGLPVTDIEPVTDEKSRIDIKKTLEREHDVLNIQFW